jgi:phosphatidylglycerophosphate synthase
VPPARRLARVSAHGVARRLAGWSHTHAVIMLGTCALAARAGRAWPLSLASLASFGALLAVGRGAFTPRGGFGVANAVTALRLLLAVGLGVATPAAPGLALAAVLGAVFGLDAIDGWIARRLGMASAFGALFDVETDALLVLIAGLQLYQRGRFGVWILTAGVLRYLYVLALAIAPPPAGHVPRSRFGRLAFVTLGVGLTAAFAVEGAMATGLAALGTGAVGVSFARSFLWSYRRP